MCLLAASKRSGPLPWAFWKFDFPCSSRLRSYLRFYGSVVLYVLLVQLQFLHTNYEQGKMEFDQLFHQVKFLLRLNRCLIKHPLIQVDTESTFASHHSSSSDLRYILQRRQNLRSLHSLHCWPSLCVGNLNLVLSIPHWISTRWNTILFLLEFHHLH